MSRARRRSRRALAHERCIREKADAIAGRDFPVIQGCLLVIATIFVLVNLLVDLLYAVVDPRIHYQ